MTAKEKLEKLTHAWYGFALVSGAMTLVANGLGVLSLIVAAFGTAFSLALAWFFGSRLRARSKFWRTALLILSGLFTVIGVLTVASSLWQFVHQWAWGLLWSAILGSLSTYMNARSFNVLTDKDVKAYFG